MRYAVTYMPKIYGQKIKFRQKTLSMNNVNVNKKLARSLRTEPHLTYSYTSFGFRNYTFPENKPGRRSSFPNKRNNVQRIYATKKSNFCS